MIPTFIGFIFVLNAKMSTYMSTSDWCEFAERNIKTNVKWAGAHEFWSDERRHYGMSIVDASDRISCKLKSKVEFQFESQGGATTDVTSCFVVT